MIVAGNPAITQEQRKNDGKAIITLPFESSGIVDSGYYSAGSRWGPYQRCGKYGIGLGVGALRIIGDGVWKLLGIGPPRMDVDGHAV